MSFGQTNPRDAFNVTQLGISGLQQTGDQARGFAAQLFDPQSQFFQQFRSFLGSVTPTQGTNSLLAGLQAGGGNFANSQFLAGQRQKAFGKQRTDFLNTATKGFASSAIGAGTSLLDLAGRTSGQIGQIGVGLRNADLRAGENEAGFLDFLAPIAGSLLGNFLLPGVGGAIGGAVGAGASRASSSSPSSFSFGGF